MHSLARMSVETFAQLRRIQDRSLPHCHLSLALAALVAFDIDGARLTTSVCREVGGSKGHMCQYKVLYSAIYYNTITTAVTKP